MNMSEKAKGATAIAKEHYESKSAQVFYNQVMDIVEERFAAINNNVTSSPREPAGVVDCFESLLLQYMHHICQSRTRYSTCGHETLLLYAAAGVSHRLLAWMIPRHFICSPVDLFWMTLGTSCRLSRELSRGWQMMAVSQTNYCTPNHRARAVGMYPGLFLI